MVLEVRKVITILEECCLWYILKDFFIGLRGGFEKHSTRASLHSDTVEDLIRISVEGGGCLRSTALEHPFIQTQ